MCSFSFRLLWCLACMDMPMPQLNTGWKYNVTSYTICSFSCNLHWTFTHSCTSLSLVPPCHIDSNYLGRSRCLHNDVTTAHHLHRALMFPYRQQLQASMQQPKNGRKHSVVLIVSSTIAIGWEWLSGGDPCNPFCDPFSNLFHLIGQEGHRIESVRSPF